MGTYNTKSPSVSALIVRMARQAISNPALIVASAMTFGALWMPSTVCAQGGSLIPQFSNTGQFSSSVQFSNTVIEPMHTNSPSVSMKLSQKRPSSDQPNQATLRRPQSPRLGMSPKSYLAPARFRRQDNDPFGENQAGSGSPFGDATIESPIKESPFEPYNTTLPDRKSPITNPFGEPKVKTPIVDPTPRTPPMDTIPKKPVLPPGGEFTPDPDTIPPMPKPIGGTRETERARTQPSITDERNPPDPDEISPDDFSEAKILEEDPDAQGLPRSTGRRERADADDPRRPFRSNIYRPAREPSYYSKPAGSDTKGSYPANPYAAGADPNGANPNGVNPYAANPYAANPYMMNPYAAYPPPYPPPYAAPYAMNPYMGFGCPPACMGCQSCCAPTNCCPPTNSYAGCPTPTPATSDDGVYEPVVGEPARTGLGLNICRRGPNSILTPSGVPLYYFSLFGGWSDLSDLEIVNEEGAINIDSSNGVGLGAAFGQIQGRNLRSEFEFSYRNHDLEDLFLLDFAGGSENITGVGDIQSFAGMFNVYWEFVDLLGGRVAPYIGAGIGAVNVSADLRLDGGADAFNDGEDSSFAYQYIVGLNYKLREYSDLFIEYRHFAADSLRLDTSLPDGSLLNGDGELNYQTNNIFFGMRLKF